MLERGWVSSGTKDRLNRRPARRGMLVVALAGLAVVIIAGCASTQAHSGATPAATAKVSPTATATHGPTATPAATPIEITDLGQFMQKLESAITSNNWANVAPYIGPEFSFSWRHAGSQMLMPYSLQNLKSIYQNGGGWVTSNYYTSFFSCYIATTPSNQVIGFLGNGGNYGGDFLMFGAVKWQGYWVAGWGFDNPLGTDDGFSCHIDGA